MKLIKYPQSCFLLEYKNKNILIDPGKHNCKEGSKFLNLPKIDVLLVTHKHSDHFHIDIIKSIIQNSQPVIITNSECHNLLKEVDIDSQIIKPGEEIKIDDLTIKSIKQKHGLPKGFTDTPPEVIGFLIDDVFYHPGDSLYMKNKPWARVVAVPICGVVTMGPKDAIRFVREIKPDLVIPMHFEPHPLHPINDTVLFEELIKKTDLKFKILKDGESITV